MSIPSPQTHKNHRATGTHLLPLVPNTHAQFTRSRRDNGGKPEVARINSRNNICGSPSPALSVHDRTSQLQHRPGYMACRNGPGACRTGCEPVGPQNRGASVRIRFGCPFLSSEVVVCGHCLVTLSLTVKANAALKWLSSLPVLMH